MREMPVRRPFTDHGSRITVLFDPEFRIRLFLAFFAYSAPHEVNDGLWAWRLCTGRLQSHRGTQFGESQASRDFGKSPARPGLCPRTRPARQTAQTRRSSLARSPGAGPRRIPN